MITKGKSVDNLISFDSGNVTVTNVSAKGTVTLRMKYDIDLVKAMRTGVSTVDIQIRSMADSGSPGVFSAKGGKSPQDVLKNLLHRSSNQKERNERARDGLTKSFSSDVTKKVSNSITKAAATASGTVAESLLGKKRVVKSLSVRESGDLAGNIPISQTPTSLAADNPPGTRSAKSSARNLILRRGISPAQAGRFESTYASTEDSLKGILPKNRMRSAGTDLDLLKRTFLGEILDISSASEIDTSEKVPISSQRTTRSATVVETFQLTSGEFSGLGSRFSLMIGAKNAGGNTVASAGCQVDCVEKVSDFLFPGSVAEVPGAGNGLNLGSAVAGVDPDNLDVLDTNIYNDRADLFGPLSETDVVGDTAFESVADTFGVDVLGATDIYEIWVKGNNGPIYPSDEGVWVQLGEMTAGGMSEILTQNYNMANYNNYASTMQARFVMLGSRSTEFAELVFPGVNNNLASTSFLMGPKHVSELDVKFSSVSAFIRTGRIDVRVAGVETPGPIMVVRRNCTLHEKIFTPLNIDEPIRLPTSGQGPLVFEDINVKDDYVYEYRAKVFTREGRELMTTGQATITYQILNGNAVEMNLGTPEVDIDAAGDINVSFSLLGNVPKTGVSALNSVLEAGGLTKYFESDIQADRENLSDLLAFHVERIDLKTGRVESFGVVTESEFSDKNLRSANNVTSLKSGRKYRYVVSALLRTPDTLLDSAVRTKIDPTTGRAYTFKPSRYLRPSTLKRGALAATNVVAGTDVSQEFAAGFAGVQRFIDISTDSRMPSIVSANVRSNSRGHNVIRWKVKGSMNKIDHFVIVATKLGMKTIIGRSHNISSNGSFKHVDKKLSKCVGQVTYQVVPIYNDYTQGTPMTAGRIESLSEVTVKK
jgi:hypothetical protein